MSFYSSPNIPTRDNIAGGLPELLPEPNAEAVQRSLHQYVTIDATPIYERIYPYIIPDVPYSYGWHAQQMENTIDYIVNPGSAPTIQRNVGSYSTEIQKAANPAPTLAPMGVYGSLRAPGINEY